MSDHPHLPYDLEAERAVLGSVLMNRDAIIPIAPWLRADDFFLARHADIYGAMLRCFASRTPPDTRMVADALRSSGRIEGVGGVLYLAELVDAVPTSYHVEYYARIVQRDAIRRRTIAAGGRIATLGYQPDLDADALQAQAQALLLETAPSAAGGGFVSVGDVLSEIDDAPDQGDGLLTGIPDLDRLLGGLFPGNLCLLAGIPGSGKTSLGTQIAWEYARTTGPAALVSLEMMRREVVERLIAYQTGIGTHAQRAGRLTDEEDTAIARAKIAIGGAPLHIEDESGLTATDIRIRALRLAHQQGGLGILVIDYLGLVTLPNNRNQTTAQQLNLTAQAFKNLGKEMGCPVILCAQLNREVFHRTNRIPQLSDIREAGEAPADQVLVAMRPELFDSGDRPGEAELYLVKHRHGPTGVARAVFDGPRYRFRPIAPVYREVNGYAP